MKHKSAVLKNKKRRKRRKGEKRRCVSGGVWKIICLCLLLTMGVIGWSTMKLDIAIVSDEQSDDFMFEPSSNRLRGDRFQMIDAESTISQLEVDYHGVLTAFYKQHNPRLLSEIPNILARYEGKEDEMLEKMYKKYHIHPLPNYNPPKTQSSFPRLQQEDEDQDDLLVSFTRKAPTPMQSPKIYILGLPGSRKSLLTKHLLQEFNLPLNLIDATPTVQLHTVFSSATPDAVFLICQRDKHKWMQTVSNLPDLLNDISEESTRKQMTSIFAEIFQGDIGKVYDSYYETVTRLVPSDRRVYVSNIEERGFEYKWVDMFLKKHGVSRVESGRDEGSVPESIFTLLDRV